MFGLKTPPARRERDEPEKPFWISFSDLMTALMVLFLVSMAIALMAVTHKTITGPEAHRQRIDACMAEVTAMTAARFPGVRVQGHSIDFGTQALFATNQHRLDGQAASVLRAYVPRVLELTRQPICRDVFKRVIVEGFASRSGTYLHNLNLSLQRAERLLCVLLDPSAPDALSEADRKDVRNLFLVGGSSFNALKPTDAESQRIELKLEFLAYGEKREAPRDAPLDERFQCPLDR